MQIGTAIEAVSQRACSGKSEMVSAPKEGMGSSSSRTGAATLSSTTPLAGIGISTLQPGETLELRVAPGQRVHR
jgi:hypothetical protein